MENIKKDTLEVAKKLEAYFGGKIIGSAVLVLSGFLDRDLINDVDVMLATTDERISNIRRFLYDLEFKESKPARQEKNYAFEQGSLVFYHDEFDIPLHLCLTTTDTPVNSIEAIMASKFSRRTESDIIQLRDIIEKL